MESDGFAAERRAAIDCVAAALERLPATRVRALHDAWERVLGCRPPISGQSLRPALAALFAGWANVDGAVTTQTAVELEGILGAPLGPDAEWRLVHLASMLGQLTRDDRARLDVARLRDWMRWAYLGTTSDVRRAPRRFSAPSRRRYGTG